MKKLALLIMIMCFALHGKATNYADYVNPLIGTQSTYEFCSLCRGTVGTWRAFLRYFFPSAE